MEGNTPLHLAMESAHGETAALLIEAGADRSRVSHCLYDKSILL
jgi:26S proteasome non-ATPase regulatory subunit 10